MAQRATKNNEKTGEIPARAASNPMVPAESLEFRVSADYLSCLPATTVGEHSTGHPAFLQEKAGDQVT